MASVNRKSMRGGFDEQKRILIRDCWASYLSYRHALCGAHLAKEFAFVVEARGHAWANRLMTGVPQGLSEAGQAACCHASAVGTISWSSVRTASLRCLSQPKHLAIAVADVITLAIISNRRVWSREARLMDFEGRRFAALVKEIRRQLTLSQEDLARQLGVSYATVNRWENGQSKPSKLAKGQLEAFCKKMAGEGRLILPETDSR